MNITRAMIYSVLLWHFSLWCCILGETLEIWDDWGKIVIEEAHNSAFKAPGPRWISESRCFLVFGVVKGWFCMLPDPLCRAADCSFLSVQHSTGRITSRGYIKAISSLASIQIVLPPTESLLNLGKHEFSEASGFQSNGSLWMGAPVGVANSHCIGRQHSRGAKSKF